MKLKVRFLQLPVLFDAERLQREIEALPEGAWRPHPNNLPGNDALPLITKNGEAGNDSLSGVMKPTPYLLDCPYMMDVLDSLGATWGRSRLMRLSGASEVTPHIDTEYYWRDHMRVHVPIVTQPTVRFCCGDEEVNMAAGECWVFDTWSLHSVHNDETRARIHLVADTVGGKTFTTLMEQGRPGGERRPGWSPRRLSVKPGKSPNLAFETRNVPVVMTPWEMRDHTSFLMSELADAESEGAIGQTLARLRDHWHALWARSGDDAAAWPEYAAARDESWKRLEALGVDKVPLRNGMPLGRSLRLLVFKPALGGLDQGMVDAETRAAPMGTPATSTRMSAPAARATGGGDTLFDRPVFIVSPPRSGSTLLFETLSTSPDLATIGGESHLLIESDPQLTPAARDWSSNRLTAEDAHGPAGAMLRDRFHGGLRDRQGGRPRPGPVRMLEKTPKNALRIPFLAAAFPEARFIYLYRDPRPTLASMIEGWNSGRFRMYRDLPDWTGLPWSFLLTPGWRDLIGAPLNQIVANQWATTTTTLLDDLGAIPRERWVGVKHEDFLKSPRAEIDRLCKALDLRWDRDLAGALPLSRYTLTAPRADKWRVHETEIRAAGSIWSAANERALAAFA